MMATTEFDDYKDGARFTQKPAACCYHVKRIKTFNSGKTGSSR